MPMYTICSSPVDPETDWKDIEAIYRAYRKQMLLYARTMVPSNGDAEDIVHDVFLKIATRSLPALQSFASEADLRNYLLKATKHTALNFKKRHAREVPSSALPADPPLEAPDNLSDQDFLEMVFTRMEHRKLVEAIRSLDCRYREVIYYHFVLEMSVPQMAKLLERKEGTIKMQLVRGKKLLLARMQDDGGDEYESKKAGI